MTAVLQQSHVQEITVVERRPRFEGSNICSWIGFKHVMYLVEEAILEHFRAHKLAPQHLYEEYGLCLEIVDSAVRILHALHMDDLVRIEVRPVTQVGNRELLFTVQIIINRGGQSIKALTGKVAVIFRQDQSGATVSSPAELVPYVVSEINRAQSLPNAPPMFHDGRGVSGAEDALIRQVVPKGVNAFVWKWRIPYFYCHFTERLQHSGYLRLMEEVVDLFLADRDISIQKMLRTRHWIPVVPQAQVNILREALMEETLYTVYTVEEIFKNMTYTARMDCYVRRDGALLQTASGRITHGYAKILNRRDWSLVNFDEEVIAALKGEKAQH